MVQKRRDDEESAQPSRLLMLFRNRKRAMLMLAAAHRALCVPCETLKEGLAAIYLRDALDRTLSISQLRGVQSCGEVLALGNEG